MIHHLSEICHRHARTLCATAIAVCCLTLSALTEAKGAPTKAAADTITAAKAFLEMPQQDIDLLTRSMRQDMLDYMQLRDSVYKKANIYMGLSWIERLTPDYIQVHLSDVSSLQIRLLDRKGSSLPVVMAIYTIDDGDGTADSTVSFFDNDMKPLPTSKFLRLPDPKDLYDIPKDAPLSLRDIEEIMPFATIKYTVNPESGRITGTLTSANRLTVEEAEKVKPYLRKELLWDWDGKRYRLLQ